MIYTIALAGLLIAIAVSAYLVLPIRRLAVQRGWIDSPDGQRKLHERSVPSIGGVAIAGGALSGMVFMILAEPFFGIQLGLPSAAFWIGALLIFAVGFYDDIRGVDFKVKILFQVAAAYLLLHAGFRVDLSSLSAFAPDGYSEALYSIPLTILWVVAIINAVNLIDGLDGLAGGIMVIAFATLAMLFGMQGQVALVLIALPVIGALLGFLFHNTSPASVFMGDSGSLVLGYLIAAYSLQVPVHSHPAIALLIPVVVLGVPVMDTGLSVVRRLTERKAVCAPDHDHIHHRLARQWPVRTAVLVLYASAIWFGVAALLMSIATPGVAVLILAVTMAAAIMGLRTLGYLRIRATLETWRQAKLHVGDGAPFPNPPERSIRYLRPSQFSSRKAGQASHKTAEAKKQQRPKVDLNSPDETHASAA